MDRLPDPSSRAAIHEVSINLSHLIGRMTSSIPAGPEFYRYMPLPPLIVVGHAPLLLICNILTGRLESFIIFILTMYKCGLTLAANRPFRMPLFEMFLRDGIFWFLAVFGTPGFFR